MIGQVVKIVSSHIKVLGWKPSTTWFQLLASAVLAQVIRSLLIHRIPALHSQFRALVPTAAGIYRMKQWTQTISLYFFVFFCFSNKIQNIFFLLFYLKDRTTDISGACIKRQLSSYFLQEINKNGWGHHLPVFGSYFTNSKDSCGTDHRIRIF